MRTGKTLEVLDKIYKAICEQKSVGVINSTGTMEFITIVRCEDCKHGEPCNEGDVYCNKDIGTFESPVHRPEWFCADGEMRDNDA